jgi:ABC-type polysaccharide/polyol phosphate export permease
MMLLKTPLKNPRLWTTLGWLDVVQSYRRSMLGPLWITLNMTIFSLAMTLVYGAIFGIPTREYAAYIICGMVGWIWVAALITEVGNAFLNYGGYIRSTNIDKVQIVWATAYKQIIVLAHNLVVYAAAAALGVIPVTVYSLLFLPAVAIFFLMSIPLIALLAILFARYRDLGRLASSIVVIVMLLTPVFWQPTMIKGWRSLVFEANPIYYSIEFLRRPLLGLPPDPWIAAVFLCLTAALWIVGSRFYARYHRYVAFWL